MLKCFIISNVFLFEYLKIIRPLLLSTKFVRPYPNDNKNEAALLEKISIVVRNTKRLHLHNHAFHINFFLCRAVSISLKCDKNHENAFRFKKKFPGEKPPDPPFRRGALRAHAHDGHETI